MMLPRFIVETVLLVFLTQPTVAGFCQRPESRSVSVDELVRELDAELPWYYRWIESDPRKLGSLPRPIWDRRHRAESEVWHRRSKAARQLGNLGTNGWPAIPELIEATSRDISGVLAASALGRMEADKAPEWGDLQKRLVGQNVAVAVFSYLLRGKDEFGQPYEMSQHRFALVGLAAVGKTAQSATPHVLDVLRTEEDKELWGPALMTLSKIAVDAQEFVPLLRDILLDTGKYPTVRMSAADALASLTSATPETLEALRAAQKDELGLVRVAAAGALWRLKADAEEVLPTVMPLLNHKLKTVRLAALNIVSKMGASAQSCREAVRRLMNDENEAVRQAALAALERLETPVLYVVKAVGAFVPITNWPSSNPVTIEFLRWDKHRVRGRTYAVFGLTNGEKISILLWNVRAQVRAEAAPEEASWETADDNYPSATDGVFAPGGSGEFWVERPARKPWRARILYSKEVTPSQTGRRFGGNYEVISAEVRE